MQGAKVSSRKRRRDKRDKRPRTPTEDADAEFTEELMWAHQVLDEDHKVIQNLRPGSYFGERACLQGTLRSATVVSMKYSETLTLTKDALDRVSSMFPTDPLNTVTANDVVKRVSADEPRMHVPHASPDTSRKVKNGKGGSDALFGRFGEDPNDMHDVDGVDSSPDEWLKDKSRDAEDKDEAWDSESMYALHALRHTSQGEGAAAGGDPSPASNVNSRDDSDVIRTSTFTNGRRSRLSFKLPRGEHGASLEGDDEDLEDVDVL